MTKEKINRLAEAFDRGELPHEERLEEVNVAIYTNRLKAVDKALHHPPEVSVPAGFVRLVMNRLPATDAALRRIQSLRDILFPLILLAAVSLSFLFADFLGVAPLARTLSNGLSAAGENSPQLGFIAVTSVGILFVSWFIVSSFFGIRSRRTTRG